MSLIKLLTSYTFKSFKYTNTLALTVRTNYSHFIPRSWVLLTRLTLKFPTICINVRVIVVYHTMYTTSLNSLRETSNIDHSIDIYMVYKNMTLYYWSWRHLSCDNTEIRYTYFYTVCNALYNDMCYVLNWCRNNPNTNHSLIYDTPPYCCNNSLLLHMELFFSLYTGYWIF